MAANHQTPPPPAAPARIFVGGLGEAVNADELRRVFELCGGAVDSIDFVRTKGRSFAYVDFSPSAHNSLSNLFAKYNGCVWKGGKLKLEKAKEHYQKRFAREKAEEAEADAPRPSSEVPKNSLTEPDKKTIRVFFPALRKVRVLPLSGTGKHKYSFQRIDLSIRPKYFCDCEDHSGPTERGKQNLHVEAKSDGVTRDELDIMNKVMNTLFQKQNHEDTEADSDDLVINIFSKEKDKGDSFTYQDQRMKRAWPQETSNELPSKKTKQSPHNISIREKSSGLKSDGKLEGNSDKSSKSQLTANVSRPQKHSAVSESDTLDSDEEMEDLATDSESEEEKTDSDWKIDKCESSKSQLTANVSRPQKLSWKELLGDGSNNSFKIASDDAPDSDDSDSDESESDTLDSDEEIEDLATDNELEEEKTDSDGEIDKCESSKSQLTADVSRPQKLSWKELLGDSSSNAFRIASDDAPDSDESESDSLDSDKEMEDLVTDSELEEEKTDSDGEIDKCESARKIEECESDENESDGEVGKKETDGEIEECESDRELEEEKTDSDGEAEECESDPKESDVKIEECESERELEEKTEGEVETGPTETTQGASWMQKCSWTQLVSQNSSFTISKPVPGTTSARPIITSFGNVGKKQRKESGNAKQHGPSVSVVATEDDLSTKIGQKDDEQSIKSFAPVQISPAKVEISDTCNFMRSAASKKEWSKAKSAISGSRKRRANAPRE